MPTTVQAPGVPLPLDLHAALEFIAARCGSRTGRIDAEVAGRPSLVNEIACYAPLAGSSSRFVALSLAPDALEFVLTEIRPEIVLALVEGPLSRPLQALRSGEARTTPDLPLRRWRSLGYQRHGSRGFQGIGSIGWALGERTARRLDRPDIADRCRMTMQRTAATSRPGTALSTVLVREYRRVR